MQSFVRLRGVYSGAQGLDKPGAFLQVSEAHMVGEGCPEKEEVRLVWYRSCTLSGALALLSGPVHPPATGGMRQSTEGRD